MELGLYPRHAAARLRALASALPAVLVVGPRGAGKTTLARAATVHELSFVDPATRDRARRSPADLIAGLPRPLLIDEWQLAPEILGAVKDAADRDPAPGQFILTGSAMADASGDTWLATGRLARLPLHPLSQAEIAGYGEPTNFVDQAFLDAVPVDHVGATPLPDLLKRIVRGGLPAAVRLPDPAARVAFHDAYASGLVLHDATAAADIRRPAQLRRLLIALAATAGSTPTLTTLQEASDASRVAVNSWLDLLTQIHAVHTLPSFHSNRMARLTKQAKHHLVEPALGPVLLGREPTVAALGDGVGGLVESFVVAELLRQQSTCTTRHELLHLRTNNSRQEVDVIVERDDGAVLGIEVKASAHANERDARHLRWLRDELGERFVGGWVLHTGTTAVGTFGDRLYHAPIDVLWARAGEDRPARRRGEGQVR